MTSTGPPLVIKLPSQTEQIGMKNPVPLEAPPVESNDSSEEEDDEEDDWDTFQSFPASGYETAPPPERSPSISDHNSGEDSDEQRHSASMSPSNKESSNIEDHEFDEAASTSYRADCNNQMEDRQTPKDDSSDHQQSAEVFPGADEELPNIQSDQIEDEPSVMVPNNKNNQTVLDVQHIDSTDSYDNPSDEDRVGASHTLEQGSQPTELSAEHTEPLSEHHLEETSSIDRNVSVVSTNDSEETSTVEGSNSGHHERKESSTDNSENSNTMLAGE